MGYKQPELSDWIHDNHEDLVEHFQENYLPHHMDYTAWTMEEVERFKQFCLKEYETTDHESDWYGNKADHDRDLAEDR